MEIMRTVAGSRLYGTVLPTSDTDFKAVYLPTKRQVLLGKRKQVLSTSTGNNTSRNGADDTDLESFELQEFLRLAQKMQTIPVELLFAPAEDANALWTKLVKNRDKVLSQDATSFVGYCKAQALKYSLRGERLNTLEKVVEILKNGKVLADLEPDLVTIPDVTVFGVTQNSGTVVKYLDVYGRQVPMTVRLPEALKVYRKPLLEAGDRTKAAASSGGADWKALYHSARIVEEGIQLFSTGEITFPAVNREYLLEVRRGEHSFESVMDRFDERFLALQEAEKGSVLAEKPDVEWINDFVAECYEKVVRGTV